MHFLTCMFRRTKFHLTFLLSIKYVHACTHRHTHIQVSKSFLFKSMKNASWFMHTIFPIVHFLGISHSLVPAISADFITNIALCPGNIQCSILMGCHRTQNKRTLWKVVQMCRKVRISLKNPYHHSNNKIHELKLQDTWVQIKLWPMSPVLMC